jgi:hypothetical protein
MSRQKVYVAMVLVGLFGTVVPALAHHALQAEFDVTKRGTFTGVLTKFSMVNPHVRWFFDVKSPDGTVAKWEVTAGGPGPLRQNGLTRDFKVGTTFTVVYAPARDGTNLGRAVDFRFPEGHVVTLYHDDPNNPNDR